MLIDLKNPPHLYDLIYADCPWQYSFSKCKNRKIENHYLTMTLAEIKELQIPSAENCVLYLWATAPKLLEALETMEKWGFLYKTHMIWDKEIVGMGYWFRGQHELLLVGVKGHISPPNPSHRISSILRSRRTEHSQKPFIIRKLLNKWFPTLLKLELFARTSEVGFDCWGFEAPSKNLLI